MGDTPHDAIDRCLIEDWQRNLPLVSRPFAAIAETLEITEASVLDRLRALAAAGFIARVGGVVRPNTLGASTLAAIAAPPLRIDAVARDLAAVNGINHVYLRENEWNLWFVVTGPDRGHVDAVLRDVARSTGERVIDLRLERPYHIDLGFRLSEGERPRRHADPATPTAPRGQDFAFTQSDRALVQALTEGMAIVPRPFAAVAAELGTSEAAVIERLSALVAAGVVPRIGVIVRHRALGWRSNAMVVWDVDPDIVDRAGAALSSVPGINLCYRRRRHAREWPYNLYCMVHARSREEAFDVLQTASKTAHLDGLPRQILFSLRCFKQTGALVRSGREAA
ncbi:MAG: Lrp/AsnC family transcriptional regulator [Hyphomicrobiaceae bacterium]|nr:Lrp/AsnC family transcriptional regulator [Hyphomicrobiaceae bacterium]